MRVVIVLHRLAKKEAYQASKWYAERSPDSARRFKRAMDEAIGRIEDQPDIGSPFLDLYRWIRLKRFPYILHYRRYDSTIEVFAVAHTSRRPGYWRQRTKKK